MTYLNSLADKVSIQIWYFVIFYTVASTIILFILYFIFSKINRYRILARYGWIDGKWKFLISLLENPGIRGHCLDEAQEQILREGLEIFLHEKDFYKKLGLPHKRNILIRGGLGSGKTSLIHAISAELNRDLFYLDLSIISSNQELRKAFMSVPPRQIIVLEDVDMKKKFNFTLASFHDCLDGYCLSEDNIILISTEKIETFDVSTMRAGRIDIFLTLGGCTRYQMRKIYRIVQGDAKALVPEHLLNLIPENLFSPCDIFTIMLSCRNMPPEIIFARIISEIPPPPILHFNVPGGDGNLKSDHGKKVETFDGNDSLSEKSLDLLEIL